VRKMIISPTVTHIGKHAFAEWWKAKRALEKNAEFRNMSSRALQHRSWVVWCATSSQTQRLSHFFWWSHIVMERDKIVMMFDWILDDWMIQICLHTCEDSRWVAEEDWSCPCKGGRVHRTTVHVETEKCGCVRWNRFIIWFVGRNRVILWFVWRNGFIRGFVGQIM
jgi:hypothetical protein